MRKKDIMKIVNRLYCEHLTLLDKLVDKDILTQEEKLNIEGYTKIKPEKDGSVKIQGVIKK